jgi:hypothetical protein
VSVSQKKYYYIQKVKRNKIHAENKMKCMTGESVESSLLNDFLFFKNLTHNTKHKYRGIIACPYIFS